MCESLASQLALWRDDDAIALVVLKGAGGKAFCAGGDLHGLYAGMRENTSGRAWDNPYARRFFEVEYRLDYQIHTYPKPVLCWGDGLRTEEHTYERQTLIRNSYDGYCWKKKKT